MDKCSIADLCSIIGVFSLYPSQAKTNVNVHVKPTLPTLFSPIILNTLSVTTSVDRHKVEEFEIIFVLNNYQNKGLVPDSLFLFSDGWSIPVDKVANRQDPKIGILVHMHKVVNNVVFNQRQALCSTLHAEPNPFKHLLAYRCLCSNSI